jgi:hypothetical protein
LSTLAPSKTVRCSDSVPTRARGADNGRVRPRSGDSALPLMRSTTVQDQATAPADASVARTNPSSTLGGLFVLPGARRVPRIRRRVERDRAASAMAASFVCVRRSGRRSVRARSDVSNSCDSSPMRWRRRSL